MISICLCLLAVCALISHSAAQPVKRASNERYVFAHFMVGFVDEYIQSDWAADITLAHSKGIDGFALNCDGQAQNAVQLGYAYSAASDFNSALPSGSTPFNLFISPDFTHYSHTDPGPVATLLKPWLQQSAQFVYDGKPFVSGFWGQGTDWDAIRQQVGSDLYVVPYYWASTAAAGDQGVDGLFSWDAWPGQMTSAVVDQNMTTNEDNDYISLLQPLGKTYMAGVSPWFYAHLPASTGWPKNYLFYSDTLWTTRWQQILSLSAASPDTLKFVEIITWNDWTESSLITSYKGTQKTDGNYLWAEGFDHTAMMDLMGPYITAYKAGKEEVEVEEEMLVYWYRPSFKDASCDSTDTVGTKPQGWELPADSIFVAALTTGPGSVTVSSGSLTSTQTVDSAGVNVLAFPMGEGSQEFSMTTASGSGNETGSILVTSGCYLGEYNFNIVTGSFKLDGSGREIDTTTSKICQRGRVDSL